MRKIKILVAAGLVGLVGCAGETPVSPDAKVTASPPVRGWLAASTGMSTCEGTELPHVTAVVTVRQVQTVGGKTTTLEYGWQGTTPLTPFPGEEWDPSIPGAVSAGPIIIPKQSLRLRPHEVTLNVTVPRGEISQTWQPATEIFFPDGSSTFVLDTETILTAVKAPATIATFASSTIFGCQFNSSPTDALLSFF